MPWQHPTAQDHDHAQDHRKNWTGDDVPARLDRPITTAMDIVVLVKAMPNYLDAAKLVEQYAGMVAAGARVEEARKRLEAIDAQA